MNLNEILRSIARPERRLRGAAALVAAGCLLAGAAFAQGRAAGGDDPRAREVREAMLGIYVHGVTKDLARALIGPHDVPVLIDLLAEPGFPRRDNVVAFLAWVDDEGDAVDPLAELMIAPPAGVDDPAELRAMLGAPQALGSIASRGDRRAMSILMEMTRDGGEGGPWLDGIRRSGRADLDASNMIDAALRGLAWSGTPDARHRLERIAAGAERPLARGRDVAPDAARELTMFDRIHPGRGRRAGAAASTTGGEAGLSSPPGAALMDTSTVSHHAGITYANHSQTSSPMNDTRLDLVLRESELRAGREDFANDVMCCITVDRDGPAQTFSNSGQDVINDANELQQVLNNPVARVKVVNAILYCSGPGMNILGCAWVGAQGMALVRMSTIAEEAVLWLHEYGHNVGLNHVNDAAYIMNSFLSAGANGLSQTECNRYHVPADGSMPTQNGTCADSDADKIHNQADNCPFLYNPSQVDTDNDGQGDPCDGDADSDGIGDPSDCAPLDNTVWQVPGEAHSLVLTQDPMGTLISWSAPVSPGGTAASLRYDTLQASSPLGFDPGPPICIESNDGPNTTATTSLPPRNAWNGEGDLANVRFGSSISFAGDVNNDAWPDMVVGAPRYSGAQGVLEGRALLYFGGPTGPVGPVWATDGNFDGAMHGASVAGGGDLNNDGFDDVIVGAPGYDDGFSRIGGIISVYHGSSSGLSLSPARVIDGGTGNMQFGSSVAFAGDINNDGFDDVIVGAPSLFVAISNEGGAFLFRGSASGLSATPDAWNPVGAVANARFGASVASAGDVNNDGFDDVIVGAPGDAIGESGEGIAYVYLGSASGLSATPHRVLQANQAGAGFGGAVAGAGDINGDGYDDVIVGAKEFTLDQANEGAAFVFYGSPTGIVATIGPPLEGNLANADFGIAVGTVRDYNSDGFDDVVVGASTANNPILRAGRVHLYLGSSQGPVPFQVIEGNQQDAEFGGAVSAAGDIDKDGFDDFAAAEALYDNGQNNEGRARIFAGAPGPDPPVGGIFYYLVRAENVCDRGPLGSRSSGQPRTAPDCPLQ